MRTVVEAGWVIPRADESSILRNGAIAFDGGRIVAIGPADDLRREFAADRTVRRPQGVLLPGLINTHTHLVGGFNKAITEDVDGSGLFRRARPLQERFVNEANMYYPGIVHGLEMLKTGTTTINETWWNQHVSGKIVRDLGLRGVLSEMVREVDLCSPRLGSTERQWDRRLAEHGLERSRALIEAWHGADDGRITCRVGPHAPDMLSEWGFARLMDLASEYDLGVHMHLAQVPGEAEHVRAQHGLSPVAYMHRLGVLGPRTMGVHCVFMDEQDVQLLSDTRTAISHTAYLVAKRGYFPPMEKVYGTGIQVTFGSDWCSNDMWEIMRTAILFARVRSGKTTSIITARDALHYATHGAARALDLDAVTGTLDVGKKADLIVLDLAQPWFQPLREENLLSNIVYNAHGSDVSDVWVDGRHLVEHRRLTTLDEQALMSQAQQEAQAVWRAAAELF